MTAAAAKQAFDEKRADEFAGQLVGHINSGMISLMASIGHRTGLFDAMAELPPSTSHGIAEASKLNERYVREWLGAMYTGGIVEHDPHANTYYLPPEHARSLTRAFPGENVSVYTQFVAELGAVESRIVECFKHGGGVPYSGFGRFHEIMAEESGLSVLSSLAQDILPLVPGLTDRLKQGIDVLDVGCGRGKALLHLAETFPNSRYRGYDIAVQQMEEANAEARQKSLNNVEFFVQDAAEVNDADAYDLITTFDAVHDQAKPATVLANIYRALRPGGTYLMQDIKACTPVYGNAENPFGPFIYTVSCMHCMTVSLAVGGDGLGAAWGKELALEMLGVAGFQDVTVHELEHDPTNYYYIMTK